MPEEITVFAETNFRNQYRQFGIKTDDRRRHMYLIGKTGMGKSTILENMIVDDIRSGKGVMVVDPHGDLAEKIIEHIPSSRVNDVIYFNPADMDYPIAFNIIEQVEPHLRHLVASGLIGVFKKLWADSWGPRLEYILRNAILAVLDYPGATLLAITRMLSDKNFRKKVIEKVQDPVVKSFWVNEFSGYANNFASEAVSPIQNKVGQFLSSALIRNIVGQVKSSIDLREIMDSSKILIMNLSKGRIGEDNSALLGAMMITKVQLSVMSRVDILEKNRKDFYLYIDEFQNFTTDSFANILSEARKYRLNLIMAHQYIEQLGEIVKPAVFGNVGTLVVFRVGAIDAEELVKEFTPVFTEEDLVNLAKYEFYIKLMIDGISSDPFSARGLAPLIEEEKTGNKEKVIKVSRERYAKQKLEIEDKINRWHINNEEKEERTETRPGMPERKIFKQADTLRLPAHRQAPNFFSPPDNDKNNAVRPRPEHFKQSDTDKFNYICSRCAKPTQVSFVPDGIRPIFCKNCLSLVKKEKRQAIEDRLEVKKTELAVFSAKTNPEIREDFSSAKIAPAIGLGQAIKNGPVNFQGKKIEPKRDNFKTGSDQADQSGAILKENEDVILKP
ncbi:type IV secretion system DNA-binding domain-containing protein [Patescibacteria group bacterium]|nr:type IV secretion system DNA-binding domain-containing protein [Patescibacteria group bacterium]MBU1663045.1 type IV secretion system DNA-binding domain-containing protein [Patescibacteria group bacterium]MBU1934115.1 type IV secretion system DNA-binding domain-containing protein [Patescibacteria group bacterium]MBU2007916.1 type IV secretion system DNA-binding domain-containing protein [Patescibacteria group bacterium]MBU2233526.1 type IV secretion system DNA-binding domain-containing prote